MKFTKMSLVAALLVGSSAFALENVKVSGDAKVYYTTTEGGTGTSTTDLFNKNGAAAQAAIALGMSADLTTGISAGVRVTALTTLGLQGQLVNNVWEGTNGTQDSYTVNDIWMAGTLGKTTAKIGRMELDTPLVFSEKWSVMANTFESVVLINQDIPGTVLVGAFVGGANGNHGSRDVNNSATNAGSGVGGVIRATTNDTTFGQFWKGAYAAGAINNSFKPLTVQAWYYEASHTTSAIWVQADLNMDGLTAGVQYTSIDLDPLASALTSTNAIAAMVGYSMKDMFSAKLSYSTVADDNVAANQGVAGGAGFNLSGTVQSKLYTEAWWNYGNVVRGGTDSINLTVEAPVADMLDLGLYVTSTSQDLSKASLADRDTLEITVTASKTVGPLDATLAVISFDDGTTSSTTNDPDSLTIQAYLTYNF